MRNRLYDFLRPNFSGSVGIGSSIVGFAELDRL